ncbi:uncharacterized protein LOC122256056 [Penaeus japonicus]|uniref:uncharacterized protein LOC122256056 n=1 Tax=Penaeus japonicus TaxID=27405 RepID=UPI001C70C717|nr:uncharacterized protein LOC122256056 [Penaeus japonicus]XP_042876450.1 uncharacterized protein LOC122256056 [Penaeus japonicus]XP_042876451.1 uncharacterized protein LOC122256056 [Penaeus japonicus]
MQAILLAVRTKYGDVTHISTETLASWLNSQDGPLNSGPPENALSGMDEAIFESQGGGTDQEPDDLVRPSNIILLDVREEDEYKVSHLDKARRVRDDLSSQEAEELLKAILKPFNEEEYKNPIKIVCYCSLGYRSSDLARKLKTQIDTMKTPIPVQIFNLEGSIFKWANEDRKLVDSDGNETIHVHPYNMVFGMTLKKCLHKYK